MPGGSNARAPLVALIDESIATDGDGAYVVASVLVEQRAKDEIRADLRRLLPPRHRFHFHAEKPETRRAVLGLLDECSQRCMVYRVKPSPTRSHETARGRCLSCLLGDLRDLPVHEITLDSRNEHNDARDRSHFVAARHAGWLHPDAVYGHARSATEPLLWLADALAGAALAAARGHHEYIRTLSGAQLLVRRNP